SLSCCSQFMPPPAMGPSTGDWQLCPLVLMCRHSWSIGYPHPYFGCKFLVFFGLQAGLRCKIVKTKEFPAKSSRERSYGTFFRLLAAIGWMAALKGRSGTIRRKASEDHCATKWGNNLQGLAVQAGGLRHGKRK